MKILVADDDPCIINALKAGLVSFGYQVVTAANGGKALQEIKHSIEQSELVEIMVTDVIMPEMNGIELIQAARKLIPDLPAIIITAYGGNQIREEANTLGYCEYVEKPFGPDRLLNIIHKINV